MKGRITQLYKALLPEKPNLKPSYILIKIWPREHSVCNKKLKQCKCCHSIHIIRFNTGNYLTVGICSVNP